MSQEIIFSFENTADAVRAGELMVEADPTLRFRQIRATVIVLSHANIFVAAQAVLDTGIQFTPEYWNDIKNIAG